MTGAALLFRPLAAPNPVAAEQQPARCEDIPQCVRRPVVPLGETARQRAVEPGPAHGDRGEDADHEGEKRPDDEPVPLGAQSAYAVFRRLEGGFVQWIEAVAFARPCGHLARRGAPPHFLRAGDAPDIQSRCGAWPGALPVEEPQPLDSVCLPGEAFLARHPFGFGRGDGGEVSWDDTHMPSAVWSLRPQLSSQRLHLLGPRNPGPLPPGVPCGVQSEHGEQGGDQPDPPGNPHPTSAPGGAASGRWQRWPSRRTMIFSPGRQTESCSFADQTSRHTVRERARRTVRAARGGRVSGRRRVPGRPGVLPAPARRQPPVPRPSARPGTPAPPPGRRAWSGRKAR